MAVSDSSLASSEQGPNQQGKSQAQQLRQGSSQPQRYQYVQSAPPTPQQVAQPSARAPHGKLLCMSASMDTIMAICQVVPVKMLSAC